MFPQGAACGGTNFASDAEAAVAEAEASVIEGQRIAAAVAKGQVQAILELLYRTQYNFKLPWDPKPPQRMTDAKYRIPHFGIK
jgi:hypothetical protein